MGNNSSSSNRRSTSSSNSSVNSGSHSNNNVTSSLSSSLRSSIRSSSAIISSVFGTDGRFSNGNGKSNYNIKQLIKEQKLAPNDIFDENTQYPVDIKVEECPICFLDFHYLNTTVCCHQNICSNCYVSIVSSISESAATASSSCPFCGKDTTFTVQFKQEKYTEIENTLSMNPVGKANHGDMKNVKSDSQFTTPENRKNIRSPSSDSTSSNTTITSTKADRNEIERRIVQQRLSHPEDLFTTPIQSISRTNTNQRSHSTGSTSSLYHNNIRTIEDIEELMLMEAIHLSMLEEEERQQEKDRLDSSISIKQEEPESPRILESNAEQTDSVRVKEETKEGNAQLVATENKDFQNIAADADKDVAENIVTSQED